MLVSFSPPVLHLESHLPMDCHKPWGHHPVTISDLGEEKSGCCEDRVKDAPYRRRSPETPSFSRWVQLSLEKLHF